MNDIKNGYIGIDLGTTNSCIATSYYTLNGAVQTDVLKITQKTLSGIKKEDIFETLDINDINESIIKYLK